MKKFFNLGPGFSYCISIEARIPKHYNLLNMFEWKPATKGLI